MESTGSLQGVPKDYGSPQGLPNNLWGSVTYRDDEGIDIEEEE